MKNHDESKTNIFQMTIHEELRNKTENKIQFNKI